MQCHRCGATIDTVGGVHRSTSCPSCGVDARVCLNCAFYDRSAHLQCRETITEAVTEKAHANFCDWFRPSTRAAAEASPDERRRDQAKDNMRKLFGD